MKKYIVRTPVTDTQLVTVPSSAEDLDTPAGSGLVLRSPNGTLYRVTVSNAGAIVVTPV